MKLTPKTYRQLTFRRDSIEPLKDSDRFRVEIPEEAYEMSKAEFYQTFPNVVQSPSYQENGRYHYPKVPEKAKRFLVTADHDAPFEPQSLEPEISPGPLPLAPPASALNTGVEAERLVAQDLTRQGWAVLYRGNQHGIGYDLEAKRYEQILRVEVKSSIHSTHPELQSSEWDAAQRYQDEFVLAVVDFYGSKEQRIWYVRNPAANTTPVEHNLVVYQLDRAELQTLSASRTSVSLSPVTKHSLPARKLSKRRAALLKTLRPQDVAPARSGRKQPPRIRSERQSP